METNSNGPLLPEGSDDNDHEPIDGQLLPEEPGDEKLPLMTLSPDLDQRQRAKALSQLSLQSLGSDNYDAVDAGYDDQLVGMVTVFFEQKNALSLILVCNVLELNCPLNKLPKWKDFSLDNAL